MLTSIQEIQKMENIHTIPKKFGVIPMLNFHVISLNHLVFIVVLFSFQRMRFTSRC